MQNSLLTREDIRKISGILNSLEEDTQAKDYADILSKMADAMCHDDELQISDCVAYVHG